MGFETGFAGGAEGAEVRGYGSDTGVGEDLEVLVGFLVCGWGSGGLPFRRLLRRGFRRRG